MMGCISMGTVFAVLCWFGVNVQTVLQVPISKISLVKCYQHTSVSFFLSSSFMLGWVCMCVSVCWGWDYCLVCSSCLGLCKHPDFCGVTGSAFPICHSGFYAPVFVGLLAQWLHFIQPVSRSSKQGNLVSPNMTELLWRHKFLRSCSLNISR